MQVIRNFNVLRMTKYALSAAMVLVMFVSGCAGNNAGRNYQKQPPLEEDVFESGAKRTPTAKTMYAMAVILAAQQKNVDCEWVLKRIIVQYPDFLPAYAELAEVQVRQQRVDDAIATLDAGCKKAPADAVLRNNLGMCWLVKGDYDKALKLFTQAAGFEPYNARYRSNVATALGMLARYEESEAMFAQVVPSKEAKANVDVLRRLPKPGMADLPEAK